ncbi:MAG: hypothetical protein N3G78_05205 [Desulfobacterota bacterium]|nr:hypothetical protein [Thermodesulfobacteriota bacterium]
METVESLANFLKQFGAPNLLGIGIAVVVLYLLFSGLWRGLKGGSRKEGESGPEGED